MANLARPTVLLLALLLAACAAAPSRDPGPAPEPAAARHENLNATLWMQSSAEYAASTLQTFRQACAALADALADPGWSALPHDEQVLGFESRPPAVIVDLDETMIDNSPYQARRIAEGGAFTPESWSAWVAEARARAIPGALDYLDCATRNGVTVIYLSNRATPGEYPGTVENLRLLGFPLPADPREVVLLRGDERAPEHAKGTRRQLVAARFRVLQLLGDNLGDFIDDYRGGVAERAAAVAPYSDWWGSRWFLLANPSYGSWESAIRRDCATPDDALACKHAALRMD